MVCGICPLWMGTEVWLIVRQRYIYICGYDQTIVNKPHLDVIWKRNTCEGGYSFPTFLTYVINYVFLLCWLSARDRVKTIQILRQRTYKNIITSTHSLGE